MLMVNHNSGQFLDHKVEARSEIQPDLKYSQILVYSWVKFNEFLIGHFINQLYGIILDNQY